MRRESDRARLSDDVGRRSPASHPRLTPAEMRNGLILGLLVAAYFAVVFVASF